VTSALLNSGKGLISHQDREGFCIEWIVGPVTTRQRILVTFTNIKLNCNSNDRLVIYNRRRSFVIYDYCYLKMTNNNPQSMHFVVAEDNYILIRMQTTTPYELSTNIALLILDLPANVGFLTTPRPPSPQALILNKSNLICPITTQPEVMTQIQGSIKIFTHSKESIVDNTFCNWIIKAPIGQVVFFFCVFLFYFGNFFI
jgi:hypothetical protein